ncbi:hypothetical protein LCGC14_1762510, partial [marine sediment metagenome]
MKTSLLPTLSIKRPISGLRPKEPHISKLVRKPAEPIVYPLEIKKSGAKVENEIIDALFELKGIAEEFNAYLVQKYNKDFFKTKTLEELKVEYEPLATEYGLIKDAPDRFKMDAQQIAFYIQKVRRHRRMVCQEYPLTDTEAFISVGRNVFQARDLEKHLPIVPIDRKYNDMLVWEKPMAGFFYTMGIDTSEG